MESIKPIFYWIAYGITVGLLALITTIITHIYQSPRDRSILVSTVTIITLSSLFATVLLIPVDIALVSSTNNSRLGIKKDWATPEKVQEILQTLKTIYSAIYLFDASLCILVVPFAYFFYEESDEFETENGHQALGQRFFSSLKYTLIIVLLMTSFFFVGFLLPITRHQEDHHFDFDYFKHLLIENNGERALIFCLGMLISIGTILYSIFTATGIITWPMSLIKPSPSVDAYKLHADTTKTLEQNRGRQRQLQYRSIISNENVSTDVQREYQRLLDEEQTLLRRERLAAELGVRKKTFFSQLWSDIYPAFRMFKISWGIMLLSFSVMNWFSILVTGIDKLKNSTCKQNCGHIFGNIQIFQPINLIFVKVSAFYPLDQVFMTLLVLYFFGSSIAGVARIGIRFFWIKLLEFQQGQTLPQAMLLVTITLALITLALSYSVTMIVAPQYASFGTQTFCNNSKNSHQDQSDCSVNPELIKPCSEILSDHRFDDVCTPSVIFTILNQIIANFPLFGSLLVWAQFSALAISLLVFMYSLFQTQKIDLKKIDDLAVDEEEESLLATTQRHFSNS